MREQYLAIRRGGRREYPYQIVLCSASGKPRSVYRVMVAEAKDLNGAQRAAEQLSEMRGVPVRHA